MYMIDFAGLVNSLLEGANFLIEAISSRIDNVFEFQFNNTRYNEVKSEFDKKYSGISLPSRDSFKPVIQVIYGKSRSPIINPNTVPGIEIYFPIFDLLCLLDRIATGLSDADQKLSIKTETEYKKWLTAFKADTSSVPLEYRATESTAILLQKKLKSTTELGDLRLDGLNKAFSFYRATEELLEIRRKIKKRNKTWIGAKMDGIFDSAGVQKIQKILFEPLTVISGTQTMSKDLELILDHGIIEKLVQISTSFYVLYKKEITNVVDFFISNASLQMRAGGKGILLGADMSSYLNTKLRGPILDILYKDMELYKKYLGAPVKDTAEEINFYYIIYGYLKKLEPALVPGTPKPGIPTTLYFATGDKNYPFKCIYSLEKLILNNKGGYKEAQDVYKGLEYFADFIAKKESPDRLGGTSQIAKGLMFGVPTT